MTRRAARRQRGGEEEAEEADGDEARSKIWRKARRKMHHTGEGDVGDADGPPGEDEDARSEWCRGLGSIWDDGAEPARDNTRDDVILLCALSLMRRWV